MIQAKEQGLVQQLVAHPAVESLYEAILRKLARFDIVRGDVLILGPGQDGGEGELRAVVAADQAGSTPALELCLKFPQRRLRRASGSVAHRIAVRLEDGEGPPLADLEYRPQMNDALAHCARAQPFLRSTCSMPPCRA
jgi:hypothetical protein